MRKLERTIRELVRQGASSNTIKAMVNDVIDRMTQENTLPRYGGSRRRISPK